MEYTFFLLNNLNYDEVEFVNYNNSMPHTQPGNQYIQIEDMWVQDTHPIDPLGFTNRTVILDRPNDITTNSPY